jgi:tubulin delta
MSVVTVQVGQCGNQIGEKLFDTIVSDCFDASNSWKRKPLDVQELLKTYNTEYVEQSMSYFFSDENERSKDCATTARAVLIDMESKVVNKLLRRENKATNGFDWRFREKNSFTLKKGSGNNWSYGYCVNGPKSEEKIMDIVRRECERTDRLSGFLVCLR